MIQMEQQITRDDKIRFLEERAVNAHGALKTQLYDGWILKYTFGFTCRSNSISAIYSSTFPLEEKIDYCESCYKRQGLPCQFKITDAESDRELNAALKKRGYEVVTPTDVLTKDLGDVAPWSDVCSQIDSPTGTRVSFSSEPTEEWISAYCTYQGISDENTQQIFRQILSKAPVKTRYGAISKGEKIVACAAAALERGSMLLQYVIVGKEYRGLGLGKQICQSLLAQAKADGAEHSYLQVVQTNEAAYSLYKKLGYKKEYAYWYMKKEQ